MLATIDYLKSAFVKYNKLYFEGKLETPEFKLDTKQHWGCCGYKKRFHSDGTKYYIHYISLSTKFDRSQFSIDETLVHEMIHLYFNQKGMFSVKHGYEFQLYASQINAKSSFHISTYTNATDTDIINDSVARKGYGSKDIIYVMAYKKNILPRWFTFCFDENHKDFFVSAIKSIKPNQCLLMKVSRGTYFKSYPLCRSSFRGHWKTANEVETEIKPLAQKIEVIF